MKLEDYVFENEGDVKIGTDGGTNFFYIGTCEDLLNNKEKYEKLFKDRARWSLGRAYDAVEKMKRNQPTPLDFAEKHEGGVEDYLKYINLWLEEYRRKVSTLKTRQERMDDYKPLFGRKIVREREAEVYDAGYKILIIEGIESGAYWTTDEVDESERMKFGCFDVEKE